MSISMSQPWKNSHFFEGFAALVVSYIAVKVAEKVKETAGLKSRRWAADVRTFDHGKFIYISTAAFSIERSLRSNFPPGREVSPG